MCSEIASIASNPPGSQASVSGPQGREQTVTQLARRQQGLYAIQGARRLNVSVVESLGPKNTMHIINPPVHFPQRSSSKGRAPAPSCSRTNGSPRPAIPSSSVPGPHAAALLASHVRDDPASFRLPHVIEIHYHCAITCRKFRAHCPPLLFFLGQSLILNNSSSASHPSHCKQQQRHCPPHPSSSKLPLSRSCKRLSSR